MPCFTPLNARRGPGGKVVVEGAGGYIDRPLKLPCGQCIGCRARRSQAWALRCVHEASMHLENCFITLTYDDKNLPLDGSVDYEHWRLFVKRVKRKLGTFRYFHCGEYGERNLRPHYHAILFGLDFGSDKEIFRYSSKDPSLNLYRSPILDELWGKGFATIGAVTYQSAAYVARYVMKKVTGKALEDSSTNPYFRYDPFNGEVWEVKPEYVTMSRRPGIGSEWFKKYSGDVFPEDEVVHDGKRYRPPRYYDERFGELCEEEMEKIKAKRLAAAASRSAELSPERLKVREKVAGARLSALTRKV